MGLLPPLLSSWSRCDSWIVLQWLRFYLIASSLLLLSDSFLSSLQGTNVGTTAAFVIQCTTNKAAISRARTGMIGERTAMAGATMDPGRLYTLSAEKAMAPSPAILGRAGITVHTVLILKRNISLTERAKSVPFFRRKDYFVG